ncbi:hypothetical protein KM043_014649 [Ampulex compressa]|nr:hypothetical protein KM043_014649 [Ampulex compressa]
MYGGFLVVQPSVIWQENLATINLLETVLLEEKSSDKLRVKTVYEARGVGRRRVRILLTWCGIEWRGKSFSPLIHGVRRSTKLIVVHEYPKDAPYEGHPSSMDLKPVASKNSDAGIDFKQVSRRGC